DGDAYLLKTDTFGITQWVRTYGGYYGEHIAKIMPLEDGNFACIGSNATMGTGGGDADGWLFKVSAAGDSLWSRTYRYETAVIRSEYIWDFQPAPEGGFMMCGFVGRPFPNNQDAWVVRTDSLGNPCPPYNGCDWAVGVSPQTPPRFEAEQVQEPVVYPNPATNSFNIADYVPWETIVIFSLYGEIVTSYVSESQQTLSLPAHLPNGTYILSLQLTNGDRKNAKLVILK
ncbi:MAG TPA: T9SS type A sorting domain-containing protein, partial [Chitinophagales bacterium]|nr:T9SS type A sorting domain-containing protein [Chitinophagales bacterium]